MRQDARENRERILAAAEQVFGSHGAVGSTEEVARVAGVGIATVFRHFSTKEDLIEAALLRHFDQLTGRAHALVDLAEPVTAWRELVRTMIETGATKLMLISIVAEGDRFPESATAASGRLKAAVAVALRRAQDSGAVRQSVSVEEVYLLIRGLAQATATAQVPPATLDRAIEIVLTGLSVESRHDRPVQDGAGSDP
jgi:AcrR family transcriptional regulator